MNRLAAACWREQVTKRIVAAAVFGLLLYLGLCWLYSKDTFCNNRVGRPVFALAVTIMLFDLVVSLLATLGYCGGESIRVERWLLALISAILMVAFAGFLPGLLYKGYGHFILEGTIADTSCLFREGYGMVFPVIVAPPIAALTSPGKSS